MDLKWMLSADDKASPVFDKLKGSATEAAKGVEGAFTGAMGKFNLLTGAVSAMMTVAAGGAFSKVIKETVAWTGEAVSLSKALGITTQAASVLNLALGDVYLSKETMLAGAGRIAKTLKTEEEAFQKLGVATRDQSGHFRSTLEIMTDVNTKLGTLREGTDRNIAGMSIYGKSWGELGGLIKLNSDVMKDAEEKAKRLGLEVGEESVKNAKKYKAALNDIEDVGKSLAVRFGTVLLPALVKVGAFLGNNGPVLSDAFRWSLNALGFSVKTLGEWLGLMGYRAVTFGAILKSALTGNFADAKREYANFVAAGDDFNKRTKERWGADWGKDADITSKAIKGDQLPTDFTAKADADAADKKVKIWKDAAVKIVNGELDSLKKRLDQEKEHLKKVQSLYEEHVKELDTFRESAQKIKDKITARNKTAADDALAASRIGEDSYQKYFRQQAELQTEMNDLENSPGWSSKSIIEKAEKYNDLIDKAKTYADTVKTGAVENVSAQDAERNFLIVKESAEASINRLLGTQEQQLFDNTVKLDESVEKQQKVVTLLENQNLKLEAMKKNIEAITDKDVNINIVVTGMEQLSKIQAVMNGGTSTVFNRQQGLSASEYYQQGDSMYWGDGSYAGPAYARGTDYVPADGPAYLHKGEAVIPAAQNTGGGNVTVPNINVYVQNGDSKEIARNVWPEIQKLQTRYRSAT
jgi:hemoglobin-like flavoprotein